MAIKQRDADIVNCPTSTFSGFFLYLKKKVERERVLYLRVAIMPLAYTDPLAQLYNPVHS